MPVRFKHESVVPILLVIRQAMVESLQCFIRSDGICVDIPKIDSVKREVQTIVSGAGRAFECHAALRSRNNAFRVPSGGRGHSRSIAGRKKSRAFFGERYRCSAFFSNFACNSVFVPYIDMKVGPEWSPISENGDEPSKVQRGTFEILDLLNTRPRLFVAHLFTTGRILTPRPRF